VTEAKARNTERPSWGLLLAATWAGATSGGLLAALLARFVLEGFALPVHHLIGALVAGLAMWFVGRGRDWRGAVLGGVAAAAAMLLAQWFHLMHVRAVGWERLMSSDDARSFLANLTWLHWVLYAFGVYVGAHLGFHGREAAVRPLERERDNDEQTLA
jgi:hypothetical protein